METVQWKVDGMDCTNCALTIRRYLEKEGMKNVKVNFGTGDVSFEINAAGKERGQKDESFRSGNEPKRLVDVGAEDRGQVCKSDPHQHQSAESIEFVKSAHGFRYTITSYQ